MSKHFVPWWTIIATGVVVFGTAAAALGAGALLVKWVIFVWSST